VAILLELVEDGIEGAVPEPEQAPTALLDLERQLVSVARGAPKRGKDEGLVAALRQLLDLELRHASSRIMDISQINMLIIDILVGIARCGKGDLGLQGRARWGSDGGAGPRVLVKPSP